MKATELLQEIRKMRGAGLGPFKEAYEGWHAGELTQTHLLHFAPIFEGDPAWVLGLRGAGFKT